MDRRSFLAAGLASGAALAARPGLPQAPPAQTPFRLLYAPHFGLFAEHAGKDPVDQVKFMHDQGFRALEDNGMMGRPVAEQERIAAAMERLGMAMGVFVAYADFKAQSFVGGDPDAARMLVERMKAAVETAARVRARWATVVPGACSPSLEWDYQTARVVDLLRRCAEVCEKGGLTMVLEPLNPWRDHPGLFLTKIPQAYQICRAVKSPACKILDDLYHQQVTEGNLIPNIDLAWEEIAYIQIGDNPGRREPGTGEINYKNVFRHLHRKGYQGILGMEHGKSLPGKEGERAVLAAYRECDSF